MAESVALEHYLLYNKFYLVVFNMLISNMIRLGMKCNIQYEILEGV